MSNRAASSAVVFVEPWRAVIARSGAHGPVIATMRRRHETRQQFLGRVARAVELCRRLAVLGEDVERLEFERAYVSLTRRPDRIVGDESVGRVHPGELAQRLTRLAA